MQAENYNPMDKAVTRVVLVALLFVLGSGTAQAQPDQNKQVYSPGQGGWILNYIDPDVDGWHDPNEAWFTRWDPNMTWGPDNSCWMASASNLLVFEGRVNPYFGWLGVGGATSPSPRPWGGQITAGGGGAFMTFDDGGWQHWALDQVGVARQGPIITTSEFTPGTWAINPITWCQARLAEGYLCGLTVYWGTPNPDAIPVRVDPEKAGSTGYHAITLIDVAAGTMTITDSDDLMAGPQQFTYTWDGTDWIIKDLYYSPDPNSHVKEAHVNYAVALQAKLGTPTTITYQGRLKDGGSPVDGEYDFQFKLFDYPSVFLSNQVGPTITKENIILVAGTFTAHLDFGSGVFTGNARWLEIGVRPGNSSGAFTTLSPLQELTRTPYAIYANTAGSISGGIIGGGTSGYLAKFIDPNTIGDSVIYESPAGKVGIGTNSPSSSLTIAGLVESLSSGYKFPDGSIQTTASSGDGHSLDAADGIPLDAVYVDNDGKVGIGTTSPLAKIHLVDSTNPHMWIDGEGLANPVLYFRGGSEFSRIQSRKDLKFNFYNGGWNDLVTITETGKVGIGPMSPAYKLDVNGDIQCVALPETSDARLKTNVRQLAGMLEKIDKVRGISFEWNEAAEAIGATAGQVQIGMVAQEVEAVFPEIVSTPEDGYKSVDYTKLTAVLIEAVKELKSQNQELERRIDVLERTIQHQQCNR